MAHSIATKKSLLSKLEALYQITDLCTNIFFKVVISGVLRGSGRQYIGAIVNFIAYYIIGIPLAVVFGFKTDLGVFGIWIGMAIGNFTQVRLSTIFWCPFCYRAMYLVFLLQCLVFVLVLVFTNWQKESEKVFLTIKQNSHFRHFFH